MKNQEVQDAFVNLSTPLIFDACLRLQVRPRVSPHGIHPVVLGSKISGSVRPARHYGSVDLFLEAMSSSSAGDILVIDNQLRTDEGCIGDLTVLEAKACGLAGLVVWGCHRDTSELIKIAFPVFSYGACLAGPQRLDARDSQALVRARFGTFHVGLHDVVFADDDGVIFVPSQLTQEILSVAQEIQAVERKQANEIQSGNPLYQQLRFKEYLAKRDRDHSYSFRRHLREIGGAIEE